MTAISGVSFPHLTAIFPFSPVIVCWQNPFPPTGLLLIRRKVLHRSGLRSLYKSCVKEVFYCCSQVLRPAPGCVFIPSAVAPFPLALETNETAPFFLKPSGADLLLPRSRVGRGIPTPADPRRSFPLLDGWVVAHLSHMKVVQPFCWTLFFAFRPSFCRP